MSEILGLAGMLLIAIGWIFETKQIVKRHHSAIDWTFGTMYLAGSILLLAYALSINSWIFAFLNVLAAGMALFSLAYKWNEKRKEEKKEGEPREHKMPDFERLALREIKRRRKTGGRKRKRG